MEMTKEDYELFMQFKQFMATKGNIEPIQAKEKKHRREKGTGSVTKLSGARKRPFLASVTLGYDEWSGKQIQKPLAYFIERKQADKALDLYILEKDGKCSTGTLIEYIYSVDGKISSNCDFINLSANNNVVSNYLENGNYKCPTFKEIWDIIYAKEIGKFANNTIINYRTAFNRFEDIFKLKINTITLRELQPIFDKQMELGSGRSKLSNMKIVVSKIFNYAMKYDYIDKDYSKYISIEDTSKNKKNRIPFTNEEIKTLINDGSYESKVVLIYIMTGMRPQEFVNIKIEDIHIDEKYMIGGIKTDNGKNRIIPLHDSVIPLMYDILNRNKCYKYILGDTNGRNGTETYRRKIFFPLMERLNMVHDPYDTRHTFATISKVNGVNDYARKKIMGHSCKDLTDDVYTHSPLDYLLKEINKIKIC